MVQLAQDGAHRRAVTATGSVAQDGHPKENVSRLDARKNFDGAKPSARQYVAVARSRSAIEQLGSQGSCCENAGGGLCGGGAGQDDEQMGPTAVLWAALLLLEDAAEIGVGKIRTASLHSIVPS